MKATLNTSNVAIAALLAIQPFAGTASAESLADKMRAAKAANNPPVEINVACGKLTKANCNVVVNDIAARMPNNITLKPEETDGSHMSAEAVCEGFAISAVGQSDTFRAVARTAQCANKFELVGEPLYPYYGYMIVRADYPVDYFSKMIEHRNGKAIRIAAGDAGSGGHDTLQAIKEYSPEYMNAISRETATPDTALDRLTDRQLDAFFVMDAPDSQFIANLKSKVDAKGRPLFKFIALDLPYDFYSSAKNKFGDYKLYTEQRFSIPGWIFSADTISTPASLIVNKAFRDSSAPNSGAISKLRQSAIDAAPTIRERTSTPETWSPALAR
jgi:TRAP-type uncharacterized transport system substrate-binding protein